jgi:Secretion system C-terminal sorting domain
LIKYRLLVSLVFFLSFRIFAQEEAEAVKVICNKEDFNVQKWTEFRQMAVEELVREKTANFEVTYIDVPEKAKLSIQAAVDIWSSLISSKMPIRVLVNWVSLGERTLATAGSTKIFRNAQGLPIQNTWYVAPLAESLLEKELNSGDIDIEIKVNSAIRWYYGQGQIKFNEFDLTTVILHEIAHALGVSSSFDISDDGRKGFWGGSQPAATKGYYAFDYFIENSDNVQLVNKKKFLNNSIDLKSQLTSNQLYFSFKRGQMAGDKIKIYAPTIFEKGSSISHFDEVFYPFGSNNSLLTPKVSPTEINYDPGVLLLNCLQNLGWKVVLSDAKLVVKDITAFPNPVIDEINVQFPYTSVKRTVNIDLVSILGVTLESYSKTEIAPIFIFSLQSKPSGVYFLKVLDNEKTSTIRIVKP